MKRVAKALAGLVVVVLVTACEDVTRPPTVDRSRDAQGGSMPPDLDVSTANGGHTECNGTLSGAFQNVVVPPGGFCFLVNATVEANVTALEGSVLAVFDTQIGGNIFGRGADVVNTGRITVGENIRIRGGGPHPVFTEVAICGADVTGNVTVDAMTGDVRIDPEFCGSPNTVDGNVTIRKNVIPAGNVLSISRNIIGGETHVNGNVGPGSKLVQGNTIVGTLTCDGNESPFVGGPNVAARARGQCF